MKTATKKTLISLISLLVILVGLALFGLYKIQSMDKSVFELENQLSSLSQVDSITQFIRSARNNAQPDLLNLEEIVMTRPKLVSLIETLEGLGQSLSLETTIISVNTDKTTIHMVVETEGGFVRSVDFLRALENLPHRVVIVETSLSASPSLPRTWSTRSSIALPFFEE